MAMHLALLFATGASTSTDFCGLSPTPTVHSKSSNCVYVRRACFDAEQIILHGKDAADSKKAIDRVLNGMKDPYSMLSMLRPWSRNITLVAQPLATYSYLPMAINAKAAAGWQKRGDTSMVQHRQQPVEASRFSNRTAVTFHAPSTPPPHHLHTTFNTPSHPKAQIVGRGNDTLRGLARSFRMMDDAGDGKLDRADLKWGLKDYGVELLDDQIEALIDHFDTNGDGFISFGEFLRGLRGELNDTRKAVINAAYDVLDSTHDGRVTFADIKRTYSAADHPMVESGRKTEAEVLKEFMGMWDTQDHDGVITRAEFEDYYADMSAHIDDDNYFVFTVASAWRLGGGEGDVSEGKTVAFK